LEANQMIMGSASSEIGLPIEQVFQFVVIDFAKNYRRWAPEVQNLEILTDGPLKLGSRARQIRIDQGRRSDTCFQVTALEPLHKVCFAETSRKYQAEYAMRACSRGTHLRFEFRLQKVELYMRPFEKLIRIAIQDGTEKTVRNIKQLVESHSTHSK
jgi:hypothetical protein